LNNIGAKVFYGKFCAGGINHIAIRTLQSLLLKICLLVGVKVFCNADFKGLSEEVIIDKCGPLWKANVFSKPPASPIDPTALLCNVLIGADGGNSVIAAKFGFERKTFQGSQALGITANFVNKGTKGETSINEFGLLSIYHQQFFKELNTNYSIDLENLVYYRGETHYFVMTAKKDSLLKRGVCKHDAIEVKDLLTRENVDYNKLEAYVRQVATHIKLPVECPFALSAFGGTNDVQLFDFSKKMECTQPFLLKEFTVPNYNVPAKLVVAVVGDALVEPFWPLGTGANRAILSAMDTAWMIRNFFSDSSTPPEQLIKQSTEYYRIMVAASPEDITTNFGMHTINPFTRYKKTTHSHFH